MDRQEAKLILQARRLNELDAGLPAFDEALALAESDPELKEWWDAQQAFDHRVTAKLRDIAIPDDLRATILAGRKIERLTPQPHLLRWLAAAALIAVLCVAGTLVQIHKHGPFSQSDFAAMTLPLLHNDAPLLAMQSPDHDKLMDWLKTQGAPIGTLPPKMNEIPSVGCQKFMVHGHPVTLICFVMADGGVAHLFMIDQSALTEALPSRTPEYAPILGWATAAWSDGHMSYLLATRSGGDALKQLL